MTIKSLAHHILLQKGNKTECEEGELDVNSQGKLTAFPHKIVNSLASLSFV